MFLQKSRISHSRRPMIGFLKEVCNLRMLQSREKSRRKNFTAIYKGSGKFPAAVFEPLPHHNLQFLVQLQPKAQFTKLYMFVRYLNKNLLKPYDFSRFFVRLLFCVQYVCSVFMMIWICLRKSKQCIHRRMFAVLLTNQVLRKDRFR